MLDIFSSVQHDVQTAVTSLQLAFSAIEKRSQEAEARIAAREEQVRSQETALAQREKALAAEMRELSVQREALQQREKDLERRVQETEALMKRNAETAAAQAGSKVRLHFGGPPASVSKATLLLDPAAFYSVVPTDETVTAEPDGAYYADKQSRALLERLLVFLFGHPITAERTDTVQVHVPETATEPASPVPVALAVRFAWDPRRSEAGIVFSERFAVAHMPSYKDEKVVFGAPLPRGHPVSFCVCIFRSANAQKGDSLGGCYYIGVATRNPVSSDPAPYNRSFWAVHDSVEFGDSEGRWNRNLRSVSEISKSSLSPKGRVFGSGDVVLVGVDPERNAVHFHRDDIFLGSLGELPAGQDLVPFVFLYNRDAAARILSPEEAFNVAGT